MRRSTLCFATAALTLLTLAAVPSPASACGGFFCNNVTLSPIYQAGERIVFARHDDQVAMHIEVMYSGDPTAFAWILPIPSTSTVVDGEAVPLEEIFGLSDQRLFDTLQNQTDPTFGRTLDFSEMEGGCTEREDSNGFFGFFGGGDVAMAGSTGAGADETNGVVVTQSANVGPYDAQLIEATSGQALFDWLNDNEYYQDPAALSLLEHYVDQDFAFIGIRLENGAGTGAIQPISLTLDETAPCVPLRLTSIAATPEMPMLVWVLGEGRAVPKNFIHAVVNEQALTYPGAANYVDVVTAAVDTASGRAWVTEFAGPSDTFAGQLLTVRDAGLSDVTLAAERFSELGNTFRNEPSYRTRVNAILQDVLADIPMPEGLIGYPRRQCSRSPGYEALYLCEPNGTHLTTEAEYRSDLTWYLGEGALDAGGPDVDAALESAKQRIYSEIFQPLVTIQALFDVPGLTLTRFFTTMDADEMTRDPIFSFNPDLPDIARDRSTAVDVWYEDDCTPWCQMTYPDGSEYVFACPPSVAWGGSVRLGPVPNAPALRRVELLEESGLPRVFGLAQVSEVDQILDLASATGPTLPAWFVLEEPAPEDPGADAPPKAFQPPQGDPGAPYSAEDAKGCAGGSGPSTPLWSLMALLALALTSRRRGQQAT